MLVKFNNDNYWCFRLSRSSESEVYTVDGLVFNKHGQIVQEIMDITGAWKRLSSECLRKLTPAKLFSRRSSDSMEPSGDVHKDILPPSGNAFEHFSCQSPHPHL